MERDDGEEAKVEDQVRGQTRLAGPQAQARCATVRIVDDYRDRLVAAAEAKVMRSISMNGRKDRQTDNDQGQGQGQGGGRRGTRDSDRGGSTDTERKEGPLDVTDWDRPPRRDKEKGK